jgi:prepilin peptidase CpaA
VDPEAVFRIANVVVLFAALIAAAFTDLTQRKVFNWTTYPATILGLALGYLGDGLGNLPSLSEPGSGLVDRGVGWAVGFGVFFLFNRAHDARAVGVGDVKLMGAIGALVGTSLTIWAMFWGSLIGAVIAVWILISKGELMRGVGRSFMAAIRLGREPSSDSSESSDEPPPEQRRIPYGVALSFGTLVAWFLHSPGLM